jgi:hypothetical protein
VSAGDVKELIFKGMPVSHQRCPSYEEPECWK